MYNFDILCGLLTSFSQAMGNKIETVQKKKKLTASEARKKKKDRMARRKAGEEVFTDEEDF